LNTTLGGILLSIGMFFTSWALPSHPQEESELRGWTAQKSVVVVDRIEHNVFQTSTTTAPSVVFRHGDISWLPALAKEAGWPEKTWKQLGQIILRESGGCPNRKGGDVVDKDCNIIRVSEWSHRSDTGLLQINGINYNKERNKWARVCLDMGVCTQEPLLDALTNLKAGYILYTYAGFGPWDPCQWGPEYAHRCKKPKKP
jgi:hypothetical protein